MTEIDKVCLSCELKVCDDTSPDCAFVQITLDDFIQRRRESVKKAYYANPQKKIEYVKKWQSENRDKVREYQRRYDAKKRGAKQWVHEQTTS